VGIEEVKEGGVEEEGENLKGKEKRKKKSNAAG